MNHELHDDKKAEKQRQARELIRFHQASVLYTVLHSSVHFVACLYFAE